MTEPGRRPLGILASGFVLFAATICCDAQLIDVEIDAKSPVWWTLSDSITPAELRDQFRDADGSRRRYEAAVGLGLEHQMSEKGLEGLRFYLNPKLTPELVPMWWAFDNLCQIWMVEDGEVETRTAIRSYGASERGAETVVSACRRHTAQFQERMETLGPEQSRFIEIQWRLWSKLGNTPEARQKVSGWIEHGDAKALAEATGLSQQEIEDLLESSRVNAAAESAAPLLQEIRTQVSKSDWLAFRRFLLEASSQRLGTFKDS